ncbi:MAG: hypothetical protein AAGK21_16990 [Bacteroidota bacterium]
MSSVVSTLAVGALGLVSGAFYGLNVLIGIAWKAVSGCHPSNPDLVLIVVMLSVSLSASLRLVLLASLRLQVSAHAAPLPSVSVHALLLALAYGMLV